MRWRAAKHLLDQVELSSHERCAGFHHQTEIGRLRSAIARICTRQKRKWWLLATGEEIQ